MTPNTWTLDLPTLIENNQENNQYTLILVYKNKTSFEPEHLFYEIMQWNAV